MPQGAGVLEVLGAALRREPPDLKCSHFICEKSTGVSEARGAGSPLTAPWSNAALPSQPPGSAGPHPLSPEMGPAPVSLPLPLSCKLQATKEGARVHTG